MTAPAFALCTKCTRNHTAEGICVPCQTELGTRKSELGTRKSELGTRSLLNAGLFLVPSPDVSGLGSTTTPSPDFSPLQIRILGVVSKLRDERCMHPPKGGNPNVVPFALSYAMDHCGAESKGEASRAIEGLVKAGELIHEYTLRPNGKRFGTRCYSLGKS